MANCIICKKFFPDTAGKQVSPDHPKMLICQGCHNEKVRLNSMVKDGHIDQAKEECRKVIEQILNSSEVTEMQLDFLKGFREYYFEQIDAEMQEMISKANSALEIKEAIAKAKIEKENKLMAGRVYSIAGARGRKIDVFPNRCIITTSVTAGSVLTNNATDGEKTIYYQDCVGIQYKKPGIMLGFVQLETPGLTQNNASSNFFNENSFTYEVLTPEIEEMVQYIKDRTMAIKDSFLQKYSPADEILKLKKLLEDEIITSEEFYQVKKQILGI